jgi:hypothetical protein
VGESAVDLLCNFRGAEVVGDCIGRRRKWRWGRVGAVRPNLGRHVIVPPMIGSRINAAMVCRTKSRWRAPTAHPQWL